jgi:hypothetical protein
MPYRRRQQDAAQTFAWPPTREDLDLIEVVDADTLRPVHARCNEPEPAQPVQLDLLKAVTPVRPVRTPLPLSPFGPFGPIGPPDPLDTPDSVAFSQSVGAFSPSTGTFSPSAGTPSRRVAVLSQPPGAAALATRAAEAGRLAAASPWTRLTRKPAAALVPVARPLPFPRRAKLDVNWLVGTCGIVAIAMSAYFSLRTSTAPVDIESALSATVDAAPMPRLPARPFPSLELNPWLVTSPRPQPPPASQSKQWTPASKPPASRASAMKSVPKSTLARATPSRAIALPRDIDTRDARGASKRRDLSDSAAPLAASTRTSTLAPTSIAARPLSAAIGARPVAAPEPVRVLTSESSVMQPLPSRVAAPANANTGAAAPAAQKQAALTESKPAAIVPSAAPVSAPARASATAPATGTSAATPAGSGQPMQQQIYAALHEYERGYEQLDANAVRAVWPSVDARALARAFHDLKSQTLVFDRCNIDVARAHATAACRGYATYQTRVGEQAMRTERREWTFRLQKSDEAWEIVSASTR